jgi:hypothetical protein
MPYHAHLSHLGETIIQQLYRTAKQGIAFVIIRHFYPNNDHNLCIGMSFLYFIYFPRHRIS